MKPDHRTRAVVVITAAVWLVWDAYVWLMGRETISAVFGWAFSLQYTGWWCGGTYGFLVGHLAGMLDREADLYWWRVVGMLVPAAVGFVLTRWS